MTDLAMTPCITAINHNEATRTRGRQEVTGGDSKRQEVTGGDSKRQERGRRVWRMNKAIACGGAMIEARTWRFGRLRGGGAEGSGRRFIGGFREQGMCREMNVMLVNGMHDR